MKHLIFIFLFSISGLLTAQQQQQNFIQPGLITVTATAEREVIPNGLKIAVTIAADDDTGLEEKEDQLIRALRRHGITEDDFRTTGANFYKYHYYKEKKEREKLTKRYTLHLQDLEKIGVVYETMNQVGIQNAYITEHLYEKEESLKKDLLREAVINARKKAEILANAAGEELGSVVFINDETQNPPVMYRAMDMAEAQSAGMSGRYEPQFQMINYSIQVQVGFLIKKYDFLPGNE